MNAVLRHHSVWMTSVASDEHWASKPKIVCLLLHFDTKSKNKRRNIIRNNVFGYFFSQTIHKRQPQQPTTIDLAVRCSQLNIIATFMGKTTVTCNHSTIISQQKMFSVPIECYSFDYSNYLCNVVLLCHSQILSFWWPYYCQTQAKSK